MDGQLTAQLSKRTALIVAGMQHDYCDPNGMLSDVTDIGRLSEAFDPASRLLKAARLHELLVLHLWPQTMPRKLSQSSAWAAQQAIHGYPEGLAVSGTWGAAPLQAFAPKDGEFVVSCYRPGGMHDSQAPLILRSHRVETLIFVGVETHAAILASAIQAVCSDFHVIVAEDAVRDCDPEADVASRAVLRRWCLLASNLELRFGHRDHAGEPQ